MMPMIRDMKRLGGGQERVAEIGKFDFRWGTPHTAGYYHHWSNFSEVSETPDDILLILSECRKIVIPKSAFQTESEAQQFLAKARSHWETAIQREWEQEAGAVWPPAPQPGA